MSRLLMMVKAFEDGVVTSAQLCHSLDSAVVDDSKLSTTTS